MKTWQVTTEDPHSGLTKWADGLYEAFVQLEPVATTQDGFFGQIQQTSATDLAVSLVTSNGHEIRRRPAHIRNKAPDIHFVNILNQGRSQISQKNVAEAAPMDVSIVDTRIPYAIRHGAPFQLISIAVPSDWIARQTGFFHPLSRTSEGRELSSIICGLSKMLLAVGPKQSELEKSLANQLRHSLTLLPQMARSDPARRADINILQSYVRRHFHLADLRAETLANHFGISVRRIHQLFEPTDQTVSQFINDIRLTRAAMILTDPGKSRFSISDVGWQVGYGDPSYFTRRFRRRFGCSPRTYRQEHLSGLIARLS